jgi:GGDEF domain-containing protein
MVNDSVQEDGIQTAKCLVLIVDDDQTASLIGSELLSEAGFHYQDEEIPLAISIGCTTVTTFDQNSEAIFKRVDKAQYEAKRAGRNRSEIL